MENTRKNLRTVSIVVLALAGLSLLSVLFETFFGELHETLKGAAIPEGAPDNIVMITKVFVLVISVLLLIPQVYIGIKGIKIAAKPDDSCAHIVWGIILIVINAGGLISPFIAFLQGNEAFGNGAEILSILVDIGILFEFVKLSKDVREGR
jgi:hypothetical protein